MIQTAIVDTSALIAAADQADPHSEACIEALSRADLRLAIPALCIAEASFLVAQSMGPLAEARFLAGLGEYDVRAPDPEDWARIAALVRQYAEFPLSATDASVIALAERLRTDILVTVDRRHFPSVRPAHVDRLQLLPEL